MLSLIWLESYIDISRVGSCMLLDMLCFIYVSYCHKSVISCHTLYLSYEVNFIVIGCTDQPTELPKLDRLLSCKFWFHTIIGDLLLNSLTYKIL